MSTVIVVISCRTDSRCVFRLLCGLCALSTAIQSKCTSPRSAPFLPKQYHSIWPSNKHSIRAHIIQFIRFVYVFGPVIAHIHFDYCQCCAVLCNAISIAMSWLVHLRESHVSSKCWQNACKKRTAADKSFPSFGTEQTHAHPDLHMKMPLRTRLSARNEAKNTFKLLYTLCGEEIPIFSQWWMCTHCKTCGFFCTNTKKMDGARIIRVAILKSS